MKIAGFRPPDRTISPGAADGGRRCGILDCFPGRDRTATGGRCERLSGRMGPETGCPELKNACSVLRRSAVRSGGKDASSPACPAGAFFFRFGRPQSPRRSAMRLGGSRAGEDDAVTRWGRRIGPLRERLVPDRVCGVSLALSLRRTDGRKGCPGIGNLPGLRSRVFASAVRLSGGRSGLNAARVGEGEPCYFSAPERRSRSWLLRPARTVDSMPGSSDFHR